MDNIIKDLRKKSEQNLNPISVKKTNNWKPKKPQTELKSNNNPNTIKRTNQNQKTNSGTAEKIVKNLQTEELSKNKNNNLPLMKQALRIDKVIITEIIEKVIITEIKMCDENKNEKSRDQIMAERAAKKLAKQSVKGKITNTEKKLDAKPKENITNLAKESNIVTEGCQSSTKSVLFNTEKKIVPEITKNGREQPSKVTLISTENINEKDNKIAIEGTKTREEILAEREAKKNAKQASKVKNATVPSANVKHAIILEKTAEKSAVLPKSNSDIELAEKMCNLHLSDEKKFEIKTKATTKAERRAIQEAQRAAKTKAVIAPIKDAKVIVKKTEEDQDVKVLKEKLSSVVEKKLTRSIQHRVKLFSHLYEEKIILECPLNRSSVHPAVIKLGIQYAKGIVVGSNARCVAFFNAMKEVIKDYQTPPQKEFSRGLEKQLQTCISFLQKCRPISVSMTNALKYIKRQLTQITSEESETESKLKLLDSIDTYIREQIDKAAEAISSSVQEKISNDDVILTFGCSSLIQHILFEAHDRHKVDFRVIVVDARPLHEGQEMLRRLVARGIQCTCILINAVGFIMPEVTKVVLGAHALLANGYVMSRAGTAQIAMIAKSFNVPVLVCCETHKFSERVQTDAFVYNEIGDPNDLILKSGTLENNKNNYLANWATIPNLTPLHLYYDVTPPELVTAVVTELAILPCTSVPVILRIKPTEIGY